MIRRLAEAQKNLDSLNADLVLIKNRYAGMIRYARRNQNLNNQLLFLLSAEDFNQAYKRFTYLKQYAELPQDTGRRDYFNERKIGKVDG